MISVVTAVCSVLGLPWLVAATVRSMNHVNALGKYDVKDGKATKVGVAEQRLSGLAIHSLIGAAILTARPLLRQIPLSVLMGLFLYVKRTLLLLLLLLLLLRLRLRLRLRLLTRVLHRYLGTSALDGNQMFARLKLFGTDPELVPKDGEWCRRGVGSRRCGVVPSRSPLSLPQPRGPMAPSRRVASTCSRASRWFAWAA